MTLRQKESPGANGAKKHSRYKSINPRVFHQHDFEVINSRALSVISALLMRWLPDGTLRGHEYVARNPTRKDKEFGSFKVNVRTGRWADFATGDAGGDVISLAAYLSGRSQSEAACKLARMLGVQDV